MVDCGVRVVADCVADGLTGVDVDVLVSRVDVGEGVDVAVDNTNVILGLGVVVTTI
jgi:hypothetical protein